MLTRQRAIELWQSDDLISLGMEAGKVRKQLHPEPIVSYTVQEDSSSLEYTFTRSHAIERHLDALDEVRALPNSNQSIASFRPMVETTATGVEYLKVVALSRLYLENVPHLEGSWKILGLKIAQVSLAFGVDDLGSTGGMASEEELRRLIRDAGYRPKQRDALFRTYAIR